MRGTLALILCLFAVPAASTEYYGGTQLDYDAIDAITPKWKAAYLAGDVDAILDLYTEDAWVQARREPIVRSRAAMRPLFEALVDFEGLDVVFEREELWVYPDLGLAHGIAKFVVTVTAEDGSKIYDPGRALLMYRKDDNGTWRIWRDIDTPTPDARDMLPAGAAETGTVLD